MGDAQQGRPAVRGLGTTVQEGQRRRRRRPSNNGPARLPAQQTHRAQTRALLHKGRPKALPGSVPVAAGATASSSCPPLHLPRASCAMMVPWAAAALLWGRLVPRAACRFAQRALQARWSDQIELVVCQPAADRPAVCAMPRAVLAPPGAAFCSSRLPAGPGKGSERLMAAAPRSSLDSWRKQGRNAAGWSGRGGPAAGCQRQLPRGR